MFGCYFVAFYSNENSSPSRYFWPQTVHKGDSPGHLVLSRLKFWRFEWNWVFQNHLKRIFLPPLSSHETFLVLLPSQQQTVLDFWISAFRTSLRFRSWEPYILSLYEMWITFGHFWNFSEISGLGFSYHFSVATLAITRPRRGRGLVALLKCEAHILIGLADVATLWPWIFVTQVLKSTFSHRVL